VRNSFIYYAYAETFYETLHFCGWNQARAKEAQFFENCSLLQTFEKEPKTMLRLLTSRELEFFPICDGLLQYFVTKVHQKPFLNC